MATHLVTWIGPRCPHCERAMNAWGRVCCDCARVDDNNDDNEKGGEDATPCGNVRSS